MNETGSDETLHTLRQTRTLLILTVMMIVLSNLMDPPFSTFGAVLNILALIVLIFVIVRIHRSVAESKSSSLHS